MIEEIYKKRFQVYVYDKEKIPEESLAKRLIDKTFDLVASKQNLMPYRVNVLGPNCEAEKQKIYEHITKILGGSHNRNILAPYNLIFTIRLVDNPNKHVANLIKKGHLHNCSDPKKYKKEKHNVSLEIGMFAKILTGLCLENNLGVSYQLCFKDWEYNDEEVLFSMQFGYPAIGRIEKNDFKPKQEDIIKWI